MRCHYQHAGGGNLNTEYYWEESWIYSTIEGRWVVTSVSLTGRGRITQLLFGDVWGVNVVLLTGVLGLTKPFEVVAGVTVLFWVVWGVTVVLEGVWGIS